MVLHIHGLHLSIVSKEAESTCAEPMDPGTDCNRFQGGVI